MSRNFADDTGMDINFGDVAAARFQQLSVWSALIFFRIEDLTEDDSALITKGETTGNQQIKLRIDSGDGAARCFRFNVEQFDSANAINLNQWYCGVISCDGTGAAGDGQWDLYDMALVEHESISFDWDADRPSVADDIVLGRGIGIDAMDGDLAHFCYVQKVVTVQELKSYIINPHRQVVAWKAAGETVPIYVKLYGESPEPDFSGSGNSGTVTGSPTIGDNPPVGLYPASGGLSSFPVAAAADGGDPERKRRSVAATGRRWRAPVIRPDGSISQGDRYAIGRNYWREAVAAKQGEAHGTSSTRTQGVGSKVAAGQAKAIGLARSQGQGSKLAAGQAKAQSATRAQGVGSKRAAGQGKARGVSRAHGIGTRIRSGEAKARGSTRAHGEAIRIRGAEAKGVSSTRSHAEADRIRLAEAKARSATRARAEARKTASGQASARGVTRAHGFSQNILFGEAHARSSSRSKGVGRKIAGGQGKATGLARSHGEARKAASGQGKALSSSRAHGEAIRIRSAEAKGRSGSRAQGQGSKTAGATAFARGVTRAHGDGRALRRAQAKARSSTRAQGRGRAILRGEARARGIARARGETIIILGPIAKARSSSRTKGVGRKIAGGQAKARAGASAFGILTRFEWKYELLRGETRYEFSTGYIPRDVETEIYVARRNRLTPNGIRDGRLDSRAFPPFRCRFRIRLPGGLWEDFDLTGVDRIVFTLTDLHGNRVVEAYGSVVGAPVDGIAEFDFIPFRDALAPGDRLGRWRVDMESHHEKPIFFPLRREIPIEVLS